MATWQHGNMATWQHGNKQKDKLYFFNKKPQQITITL